MEGETTDDFVAFLTNPNTSRNAIHTRDHGGSQWPDDRPSG